jgi:exodeoxyribonuclease-3
VLSLLTLNLQAAALPRAGKLLAWLGGRDDHLSILTETSNGPGTAHLLQQCAAAGLTVAHTRSGDNDRGCAIVSRLPIAVRQDLTTTVTLPGRAVAVTIDGDLPVTVVGLYVPSSDRAPDKVAKKRAFLASVIHNLQRMPAAERSTLIVGGDYNVIARHHQPRYPAFLPFEYAFLDSLTELGLTDTHTHLHPDTQVHSWFGRGGNGYRFDYFHTGEALTPHLTGCEYDDEPRTTGLSDHAAVTLTLTPHVSTGAGPTPTGIETLF